VANETKSTNFSKSTNVTTKSNETFLINISLNKVKEHNEKEKVIANGEKEKQVNKTLNGTTNQTLVQSNVTI